MKVRSLCLSALIVALSLTAQAGQDSVPVESSVMVSGTMVLDDALHRVSARGSEVEGEELTKIIRTSGLEKLEASPIPSGGALTLISWTIKTLLNGHEVTYHIFTEHYISFEDKGVTTWHYVRGISKRLSDYLVKSFKQTPNHWRVQKMQNLE